ncbi:diaminobutyrate--2-oxoglutarate transaminase [Brevibacillus sp. AY1]|uniref:diaminobutyrate--2-oxoglutarate transaminase n=1 Tax=Brevibacillus sp. AY1 TaxID=2807621 RepID=UPI002458841B|nr:diaminobutyrate--2-oxoglutarate transaminase [Brevibacillus sp. AY1]MDH4617852.1 diaminobutyrate--2-oxoglutarate transaminase [Brevibacillus sp. AY1]
MKVVTEVQNPLQVFAQMESEVRSYCRHFPVVFAKESGHTIWDTAGRDYIDFFAGAGALNYGHNNPVIKEKLIEYLTKDGLTHSLDMATEAKEALLQRFDEVILAPRGLRYKVMFPGPTGTNSVEAALKLARKVTGRHTILSFTNGFHGMTIGSLSVTGNRTKREGAGMPDAMDTAAYIERLLEDGGSGLSLPAAMILETVQGEGGINVASDAWLQSIEKMCRKHGILLIVDDVQAGCGRTGTFFSFERAGIVPDFVCLSKSIGGYGLPLALTLIKPELDIWKPGEHNGTFRGNNLAFVAGQEALNYWQDDSFGKSIEQKGQMVHSRLEQLVTAYPYLHGEVRGKGLMQGIAVKPEGLAEAICTRAFERGLVMETSGPNGEVMKFLPPLTITDEALKTGLAILEESIKDCQRKERG